MISAHRGRTTTTGESATSVVAATGAGRRGRRRGVRGAAGAAVLLVAALLPPLAPAAAEVTGAPVQLGVNQALDVEVDPDEDFVVALTAGTTTPALPNAALQLFRGQQQLSVVDLGTLNPSLFAYDSQRNRVYLTDAGTLTVVQLRTAPAVAPLYGSVFLGGQLGPVEVDPQSGRVFVGDFSLQGKLHVLDPGQNEQGPTLTLRSTATVPGSATSLAVAPGGETAYVGNRGTNTITVHRAAESFQPSTVWNIDGTAPTALAVTRDGARLMVGTEGRMVMSLEVATGNGLTTQLDGSAIQDVALNSDSTRILAAQTSPQRVTALSATTAARITEVATQVAPRRISNQNLDGANWIIGGPAMQPVHTTAPPDATPPTVALTAPAAGATVSGTVQLAAEATDDAVVAGVQFQVDGRNLGVEDTTAPYTLAWDTTVLVDARYTLSAVARDGAGNIATSRVSVRVDNPAPPAPVVRSVTPLVGGVRVEWVYPVDSTGVNMVRTQALDPVTGNVLASQTMFCCTGLGGNTQVIDLTGLPARPVLVRVTNSAPGGETSVDREITPLAPPDTTPPTIALTSPVAGNDYGGVMGLAADASDDVGVVSVQFRVDGLNVGAADTVAPYSVTLNTVALPDGPHVATAVARDAAGNTTTSAPVNFQVRNITEPAAPTGVAAVPGNASAVVSWTAPASDGGSPVTSYTVRAYQGHVEVGEQHVTPPAAGQPVPTQMTFPGLTNGAAYSFLALATNAAGTSLPSERSAEVTPLAPDTTPPVVTITSSPPALTNDNTPSFDYESDDAAATFECSLTTGAASFGACPPSGTYPVQPDGDYTFSVRAIDAAANTSQPATVQVRIDTTKPAAPSLDVTATSDTGLSDTDDVTADTTPSFTGTAENGATVRLTVGPHQPTAIADGTYSVTSLPLAIGQYTVTAVATDAAGNTSAPSAPIQLTVVAPTACHTATNRLMGTDAANVLTGTAGADLLLGFGGADMLTGLAGGDCVVGGAGNDRLKGDGGDDELLGGDGGDRISADGGRDIVLGGAGDDNIDAVDGTVDRIDCGPGTRDAVTADRTDILVGCERITRR